MASCFTFKSLIHWEFILVSIWGIHLILSFSMWQFSYHIPTYYNVHLVLLFEVPALSCGELLYVIESISGFSTLLYWSVCSHLLVYYTVSLIPNRAMFMNCSSFSLISYYSCLFILPNECVLWTKFVLWTIVCHLLSWNMTQHLLVLLLSSWIHPQT